MDSSMMMARTFNLTLPNFQNQSLLMLAGSLLLGIFVIEILLYCLDVYYAKTYYGNNSGGGYGGQSHYDRSDKASNNEALSLETPKPYRDPFYETYRSLEESALSKLIPQWINQLSQRFEA